MIHLVEQVLVDERALRRRTSHARLLLPPPRHDV